MKKFDIIKDFDKISPEYIFAVIGLIFGLFLIYANPPFQSNDEDRHFYLAYHLSQGNLEPQVSQNKTGMFLPVNLYTISGGLQGIRFSETVKLSRKRIDEQKQIPLNEDNKMFYEHPNFSLNPLPYIPTAIGINIGKMLDDNPISLLWAGRTANLFVYLIIVFFAIRLMPFQKYALMLFALTPMALFQASSITYDSPMLAVSMFIVALVLNYNFSDKKIGLTQVLIFIGLIVLHRFIKEGYFLIPFFILIIPISKYENKKLFYYIVAALLVSYFIPAYTWVAYIASLNLPPGKPLASDFLYGGPLASQALLANPVDFVMNIIKNIIGQGKEWIWGFLGKFGYSYVVMNKGILFVYGLALLLISLYDSAGKLEITLRQRIISLSIGLLSGLMVIVGFFIVASPVGATVVFGVQGRYFLPFFPIFIISMSNTIYKNAYFEKYKNIIISGFTILVLIYTVNFINNYFWGV